MAPPPRLDSIDSVMVLGLGGIGAPIAQALAQFLAAHRASATLWLVDGDSYEERNRARVVFAEAGNKAVVKAAELARVVRGGARILPIPQYVTPHNAGRLIAAGAVVFACFDNHASRKVVSDGCRRLRDCVLISGGNDGIEGEQTGTYGNVQIHVRRDGRDVTNPITRFHPELARPRDRRPDQQGCEALAPGAPQLLFTNLTVAAAMLGAFYAWLTDALECEEIYLDIAQGRMTPVKRAPASR